jgi:hypothetical protein
MEKEFIPYNLALILKELGFDEALSFYFDIEENNKLKPIPMKDEICSFHSNRDKLMIAAPTFSQAFRWFRKTHNLHKFVHYHTKPSYTFAVFCDIEMYWTLHEGISFNSYEEAELECLKKLIEIAKEQNYGK